MRHDYYTIRLDCLSIGKNLQGTFQFGGRLAFRERAKKWLVKRTFASPFPECGDRAILPLN